MIKQCKGKDFSKVPASKLKEGLYLVSIKYDGNYVQIHKKDDEVAFYTSGGKEFYLNDIANELKNISGDFILEGEYIETTDGKLGCRGSAAKLTTYRTNFSKGITSNIGDGKIIIFDIIDFELPAKDRAKELQNRFSGISNMPLVSHRLLSINNAIVYAKELANDGWEGVMAKHIDHMYVEGKRVNDNIKIKRRMTADLLCTGVSVGKGKYEGLIGALTLVDSKGIEVDVGSGLTDQLRSMPYSFFVGKIIEIEYEQIIDTYIQPTFVAIRNDKTESD